MVRSCVFVVGVCLSLAGVARAESPAEQAGLNAAKQAEFNSFVAMGKRAQLVGRYEEAATAYRAALDILPHPVIAGRYGLVLMKLGHLDKAAEELHEAHERGQGVTLQERREVGAAYDKAKALTTWVNVNVSEMGANVTCDDEPWSRKGFSSFWRFAVPGEHTLRAKLDGYEEAVETFTAKPGEEITVSLKLMPLAGPKLPELPAPVAITLPDTRVFPPMLRVSNIPGDPNYDPREDPSYGEPKATKTPPKKSGPRFSVSGGVVTVFGVASWNPAIGPVLGVGLRPNDYFSLGLEGRVAWLTTGVGGGQISAMTVGGNLSACGHIRWFFGCAVGHVGTIDITFSEQSYENKNLTFVKPGFGGRFGADVRLSSFTLRPSVDILGLRNGTKLTVGETVVADQPALLLSGQVTGGWEF